MNCETSKVQGWNKRILLYLSVVSCMWLKILWEKLEPKNEKLEPEEKRNQRKKEKEIGNGKGIDYN